MGIKCDRCRYEESTFDEQEDDNPIAEMVIAFGILSLLCLDCRKAWSQKTCIQTPHNYDMVNQIKYRLDLITHRQTMSPENLEPEAIGLFEQLSRLELSCNKDALSWIQGDHS